MRQLAVAAHVSIADPPGGSVRLAGTRAFDTGVVALHYRPAR
jgi:hypothetical protein